MWASIAAVILAIGIVNTPPIIEAEREYQKRQEPMLDVEPIQAAEAGGADSASDAGSEVN